MRIAYMTDDEVHRDLATRMSPACGATVQSFSPDGPPPGERFDAVLYDLDSLVPTRRREVIAELLASAKTRRVPVGVHTYNIEERVSALRGQGVLVARRLGPGMLRHLPRRRAIEPDGSVPPAPGRDEAIGRGTLPLEITISAHGVVLTVGC